MSTSTRESHTVWNTVAGVPARSALDRHARADVCVVGAGIAGMSTAYLLARTGLSVIVLDDGGIGGGMTARTTAHLTNAFDDRYFEVERLYGLDAARVVAQSHTAAIDRIESIVAAEEIECEFERLDGYLFAPPDGDGDVLARELKAARRAGLIGVERVARAPFESFDTHACLRFPRQAQFHPLRYLAGLARAIERTNGRIYTATHVTAVHGGPAARVETKGGYGVSAGALVIATNTPINDLVTMHTKQAPYTTYVIGAGFAPGSAARALYWDTEDPYHYVRIAKDPLDGDVLLVGGEDHKAGQAADGPQRLERLEQWARERFPTLGRVEFAWSGQVMEPEDGIAFIGRNPGDAGNVYLATGDSGQGLTHGTIAGILLTDLIMNRRSPWADLYDPARKMLRVPLEFARENLNVAAQYADYVRPGDVRSTDELKPGEGAVVRQGLRKVATYRDHSGMLHELSAVCPHLGCIVHWNGVDRTWDCPCHGSKFDRLGEVIVGPANTGLSEVERQRVARTGS